MTLQADGLSFAYGKRRVLEQITLRLGPGVTALVGPNAAGKSTLLKCLAGLLPAEGTICWNGRPLSGLSRRDISQAIGYLPQSDFQRGELTVLEAILLGRVHDLTWRVSQGDIDRAHSLTRELSLDDICGRMIRELSGGQAKLVAIAQALIRDPAVLLLDEPTANLDLRLQIEVCERIRKLARSRGIVVMMSIHDLNLAACYADNVIVLRQGTIDRSGPPAQTLTAEMMADVYQVDADVRSDAAGRVSITLRGTDAGSPLSP